MHPYILIPTNNDINRGKIAPVGNIFLINEEKHLHDSVPGVLPE